MNYRDLEHLYDRHGGKFKFTVLLQKRVRQLVKGAQAHPDAFRESFIDTAVAEAEMGKIWLDESSQEVVVEGAEEAAETAEA